MKHSATTAQALTGKVKLPKDRYAIQCMSETTKASKSSGSMMIERAWQIIFPAELEINGQLYDISGSEVTQYATTKVSDGKGGWDEEKTAKAVNRFIDDLTTVGVIDESDKAEFEMDENNPPHMLVGKVVDAILLSEEYKQCKEPTPEQIKKGQKQGDPILDDNGKPIVGFRVKLGQFCGPSKVEAVAF